ncbi:MAG: tetratricopeptide repeat protein [Gemmatimonadota bacterium]|nr:tetratricopeptide repeat protein [Gemmatimonadota bacterium]
MLVNRFTAIGSAVLAVALALPLAAQQATQCSVDEGKPGEVARAYLAISQLANAQAQDTATLKKRLAETVGALTKGGDKVENPVGHAYELGKLLVLWTTVPGQPLETTRGQLGFATNPQGSVNLLSAIDSAFTVVEQADSTCQSETLRWRSQKIWQTLVNQSIQELNAGAVDSAEKHANESLILNRRLPYGYMVLAQVARQRNQLDKAVDLFRKTIAAAHTDTLYNEVYDQSLLNLGNMARSAAADDTANAAKYYKVASDAFQTLAADTTQPGSYRTEAKNGLVGVSIARGDTAAVKAVYAAQLKNPGASSFTEVVQAGVWATQVGDTVGASTLFHAAYAMNPYHRDALSNLAITDLKQQKYDSTLALLKQLKAVDPDGDNGRLWVFTYAGIAKQFADLNHDIVARYAKTKARDVALRKALSDSATLTTDSNRVYTQMAVDANAAADSMPVTVHFTQFSHVNGKVTLAGTISNGTADDKSYTLKVDFLDDKGNVVVSQTATVGPVAAHGTGQFSLSAAGATIAAFRYAPLDD